MRDRWATSSGGALHMDYSPQDGSGTVRVVFKPGSLEVEQLSSNTWRMAVDLEEVP